MIGSTICQNFGESVGRHGYGVYTMLLMENYEYFDLDNSQPYLNFKISDIEDISDDKEILING